jgi:hypothetical protein
MPRSMPSEPRYGYHDHKTIDMSVDVAHPFYGLDSVILAHYRSIALR